VLQFSLSSIVLPSRFAPHASFQTPPILFPVSLYATVFVLAGQVFLL